MSRWLVLALSLWLGGAARAVIVYGGDGSGNATSLGAGAGWDYVGVGGGASGVYLGAYGGSYWVLTAGHVGGETFTLNGQNYGEVAGSSVTLMDGAAAVDLRLFRIDADPGLANLTLASATPTIGASLTMIGFGFGREASETRWDSSWNETEGLAFYRGYKWNGVNAKRWGLNTLAGTTDITYESGMTTAGFYTQFRSVTGSAQATASDSGGGVFTSNGTLAGIMLAVGGPVGQPANTSIFSAIGSSRSETFVADISVYRSQILGIISPVPVPEPDGMGLLGLGLGAVAWRMRPRKAPAGPR